MLSFDFESELMTNPSAVMFSTYDKAKVVIVKSSSLIISKLKAIFNIITADGEIWKEQFIIVDLILLYVAVAPCLMIGCV